jgi:nitrogen fixation NifU-like protein
MDDRKFMRPGATDPKTVPRPSDTKALYQEVILDHNKKPRNFGKLENATHHAEGHNPLCGDHLSVALNVNADRVEAIAFEGESCAICKASASMMTTNVKGKSRQDAEMLIQEFRDMATGKLDLQTQPHHLGRLTVFAGVRDLPTRVKCAILPWHTLHAALNSVGSTSTEADDDPMHAPMGNA